MSSTFLIFLQLDKFTKIKKVKLIYWVINNRSYMCCFIY